MARRDGLRAARILPSAGLPSVSEVRHGGRGEGKKDQRFRACGDLLRAGGGPRAGIVRVRSRCLRAHEMGGPDRRRPGGPNPVAASRPVLRALGLGARRGRGFRPGHPRRSRPAHEGPEPRRGLPRRPSGARAHGRGRGSGLGGARSEGGRIGLFGKSHRGRGEARARRPRTGSSFRTAPTATSEASSTSRPWRVFRRGRAASRPRPTSCRGPSPGPSRCPSTESPTSRRGPSEGKGS